MNILTHTFTSNSFNKIVINVCFSILFFTMPCVFAQDKIEIIGSVFETTTQEPLAGASISVVSSKSQKGTTTNINGNFKLLLDKGEHRLLFSFLGYETKEMVVNTNQPHLGNILMNIDPSTLKEIIINSSSNRYISDFKGSNFKISPIVLKNTNPLNTEELLRTVPGVNIVGDMGLSNRPNISIRGSWGRRSQKILLLEDGSAIAPAPYIAPGTYYNPVSDRVTAIEVLKGADILKYGPNNMYGAINYITALPPQKPELRLKLAGGGRGYKSALASYGGTWNNLGALIEGVYKKFDGFTDNSSVDVLNLNAKIYAKLSGNQSLYFKVSGQYENNQATLSGLTPFSFEIDPIQNPFDADHFKMRRYGLDIIHKWLINENSSLTSKLFASDFERDWWRQVNAKVLASNARNYLGDDIFFNRYSYLQDKTFGTEDYVRVGRIQNNTESTTDSRWVFKVSGIDEKFSSSWNNKHQLDIGFKLHQESYSDMVLASNTSRWSRNGNITRDMYYHLWAASAYVRNEFNFGNFSVTPIARFEYIDMYQQNILQLAQNPDLESADEGKIGSKNTVFLPGTTVAYKIPENEFFASIYRGFIAPSKVFGFLVERDGVLSNPFDGESVVDVKPELSINTEIGWRGSLFNNRINGQFALFNIQVSNFIAGSENEIFIEPGKVDIIGLEGGVDINILDPSSHHKLKWNTNITLLNSKVKEGMLQDKDLFGPVIHSEATRNEFIQQINNNRQAYLLYTQGADGDILMEDATINSTSFSNISSAVVKLGANGKKTETPYTPNINLNMGLDYGYKDFNVGLSGNYVGSQYTEFLNFNRESADGAIGKLPSYFTIDAYVNYSFTLENETKLNFFINGKNLGDNIYRASRLNRANSGIIPGGFRQIIFGVNVTI